MNTTWKASRTRWNGGLAGALALVASIAAAEPVVVPPDLAPGATYFLTFVTAGTRDALPPDIATYDAFVAAEASSEPALAALGTGWYVIGSTRHDSPAARLAALGMTGDTPVYRLDGLRVADGHADLFDGSIAQPIDLTQAGSPLGGVVVFTGSNADGSGRCCENFLGGTSGWVAYGESQLVTAGWIRSFDYGHNYVPRSFYAISGPLVVPSRCGDGSIDVTEECDDGGANGTPPSCCTAECRIAASGAPCDDGTACTLDDACDAGFCEPGAPTLLNPVADPEQTLHCVEEVLAETVP